MEKAWFTGPMTGIANNLAGVLPRAVWKRRAGLHQERLQPWIAGYLDRQSRQAKHPVYDFLFQYYSFRPAQLARWSPGPNVGIEAEQVAELPGSPNWWQSAESGWRLSFSESSSQIPGVGDPFSGDNDDARTEFLLFRPARVGNDLSRKIGSSFRSAVAVGGIGNCLAG